MMVFTIMIESLGAQAPQSAKRSILFSAVKFPQFTPKVGG